MRGFVRNKWEDEKVVKVSMLNDGIFLLNFATEEKKLEVMLGGPWTFDNRSFIVKEWKEEEYKCGSVEAIPVWVRLSGVKAHLTDPIILGQLCFRIGKPICTDGVRAEGSSYKFARICVKIYADQEMIEEIKYENPYGNCYIQKVIYEWKPPRCTNCCNFGHVKKNYPEQSLDELIAELKEHETQQKQMACNKDTREDIEEFEDETPYVQEVNEGVEKVTILEGAVSVDSGVPILTVVPETQEVGGKPPEDEGTEWELNIDKKNLGEVFKQYLLRSAAKRARLKERKMKGEVEYRGAKEMSISSSSGRYKIEENKAKNKVGKAKYDEKGSRGGGHKQSSSING